MSDDFLSLRIRISNAPRIALQPLPSPGAEPGRCYENVQRAIAKSGGSLQFGWAQADLGPIPVSGCQLPSLYSRWVNHAVWRDNANMLWEVTPNADLFRSGMAWRPTPFVADEAAKFEPSMVSDNYLLPSIYIAVRPEGEWTADCLCQAERAAPLDVQNLWLNRALFSLRQAGFAPLRWQVERLQNKICDAWLFA